MPFRSDGSAPSDRWVALLLSLMVVATAIGLGFDAGNVVAGGLAWTAAALLMARQSRRQRVVVAVLCSVGLLGVGWGWLHGHPPEWRLMLHANQALIGMLAAVSFLRLVASPRVPRTATIPSGRAGIWQTMVGIHLFGAVINLSAIDMVGDRFAAVAPLRRGHLLLLSRGYSSAAFWSPFWGATAAALTYAPDAKVAITIVVGGCLAAAALAISGFTVTRAFGSRVDEFQGFPLTLRALAVPVQLVVLVLAAHVVLPDVPIVGIITVCAPALTIAVLAATDARGAPRRLTDQAVRQLPAMGGELVLFLSAGLLIAGFTPIADSAAGWLPVSTFGIWEAWGLVVVMAALSAVGLHPVISIALAANLLAPVHPDATLFAVSGLIAWGVQAAGGPLSGLNVVMQGRYGVDSFTLARWNLPYAGVMLALGGGALALCQLLVS